MRPQWKAWSWRLTGAAGTAPRVQGPAGVLDSCSHRGLRGWAIGAGGAPATLDLFVDGEWQQKVVADRNRDDLVRAGLLGAAFDVQLERPLPVDRPTTLRVCFEDGRDLTNSPCRFGPAPFVSSLKDSPFDTVRFALARQYLSGEGIEIGALQHPLEAPKAASVRYVDHLDADGLSEQYPELGRHNIATPDIIDDGETLASFGSESVDFVIANRFVEHTEDSIRALINFERVLRRGGTVFLAVPDKRFTFDVGRPKTSVEHLVEDHAKGPGGSRLDHSREYVRLVDKEPPEGVERRAAEGAAARYSIHFHVWTAEAFLEFLAFVLREYSLRLNLEIAVANESEGEKELVVILRRY